MDDFTCHICAARVAIKSAGRHYAWHHKYANETEPVAIHCCRSSVYINRTRVICDREMNHGGSHTSNPGDIFPGHHVTICW